MSYTFFLPKIETRSQEKDGVRNYIVRGYATTPNNIYPYKFETNTEGTPVRAFKEFFSERGIENIKRKTLMKNVFVDVGHTTAANLNIGEILNQIQNKTNTDISEEKKYILEKIKGTDIPMFKVEDLNIDDKGLFVDIRGNPFYRDIDEDHKNYFDAVWNSLEQGFINGMSLNLKPTEFKEIDLGLTQIDDADIYGISLLSGVANNMANITEVAIRCVENVRGEKCQKIISPPMLL